MANWCLLPHDPLVLIAEHLKKLDDFVAFGGVCKSWRAAAKKEKAHFKELWLRKRSPYLMIPASNGNNETRELYSLAEGEVVASVGIPNSRSRKCYESLGWLLAVEEDGSMCLLDPFSGVEIPLPHQSTFPDNHGQNRPYIFVRKMVLSARPSETRDFIVMIIYRAVLHLAFWRPGEEKWNRIRTQMGFFSDVTYEDGKFYTIDYPGLIKVFNLAGDNPSEVRLITRFTSEIVRGRNLYILKTLGRLLVITRTISNDKTSKFQVYEVDICKGTWREINSLESMAIFVGHNATTAVDAFRFPGFIKANHIYFTDDGSLSHFFYGEIGKDMGAFNMESGKIEPFYHGEVLSGTITPPTWITPSF